MPSNMFMLSQYVEMIRQLPNENVIMNNNIAKITLSYANADKKSSTFLAGLLLFLLGTYDALFEYNS